MKPDDRKDGAPTADRDRPLDDAQKALLTRRDWILNLGGAAVLSGFAGLPGEPFEALEARVASLPPGLYQASFDHLNHALASEGPFFPVPPGAETEYLRPRSGDFVPQALSANEFGTLSRLVELILGEDLNAAHERDRTGGVHGEVAQWIDLVVTSGPGTRAAARRLTPEERALAVAYFGSEEPVVALETFEPERICAEGLRWLDEESNRRFGKHFLDSSASEQLALVESIGDAHRDTASVHPGTRLFDFVKEESVRGFYTSRAGREELNEPGNRFYGESPGCGAAAGKPE